MYGFGEELTKENILSRITSYDIFKYYSDNFQQVGKSFISDIRSDDQDPSACIDVIKEDLLYTDFGTMESFRCIDYVMRRLNLDYFSALQQINLDFDLKLGIYTDIKPSKRSTKPVVKHTEIELKEKEPTVLRIKKRKWNTVDKQYWYDRYYINSKTLDLFGVSPISHFWINNNMFTAEKNAYSYNFYWKEGKELFFRKIYQPYSKKLKWVSNGGKVYQGEGVLPKEGPLLIVTKSLKDVMVMYNLGYTAIAPPSEGMFLQGTYQEKQFQRFRRIVLFYDNDSTGITKAKEFSEQFNIEYRYIPEEYRADNIKDISDFIEKRGIEDTKELLTNLMK